MHFIHLFINKYLLIIFFIIIICNITIISGVAPILIGGAAIASSLGVGMYYSGVCYFHECCSPQYINHSLTAKEIQSKLSENLFGQHIALEIIPKMIQAHLSKKQPSKALVLSLHGSTGVGKNYLVNLLTSLIYKNGMKSQFVHQFISRLHFSHKHSLQQYQDDLSAWIRGNVSNCPHSIFIFDEANDLPPTFVDILKPFMDSVEQIDGVDYRKTIFFFLSNTGSRRINEFILEQYKNGLHREQITPQKAERLLVDFAFHEKNGSFMGTELIQHHLISAFVPFLPLEKLHVRQCIRAYLKENYNFVNNEVEIEEEILNNLAFEPSSMPLFSTVGCRRIPDFADQILIKILESN